MLRMCNSTSWQKQTKNLRPTFIQESLRRLFLFWTSLLSKRVIWLAQRTQAVRKGRHLVLHSSASNDYFYKYTPNIYKITQVKPYNDKQGTYLHRWIKRYVQDPIVMKKDDNNILEVFQSFVSHEIQFCRARGAVHFGWIWAFKDKRK